MKAPRFKQYTKHQIRFYIRRAILILLSWVGVSNLLFFYEFYTLKTNSALTSEFDFKTAFTANMIVAIIAGLIGGIFTVNLMERWLRKYQFWKALLYIVILYIIAAFVVSSLGAAYYYADGLGLSVLHPDVIQSVIAFFGTFLFLKNFFLWLVVVIVTIIIFMVNDKYGPGVFPDYLLGRYFHPKHERRIFMFADIKNATGIAEQLGENKYFNFLKDFFRDIGPAIVQTKGEVYQYVGDEIVVSWKMKNGLKRGNAVQCFYSMKRILRYKKGRYMRKYGVAPEFKVGYHYGNVMVGEVGRIKRDIVFSGDVLNTTSRIQALCNELNVEILASKKFGNIMTTLPSGVAIQPMGSESVKGKIEEIELVTFVKDNHSRKVLY